MEKILMIPDVHEKIGKLQTILKKYNHIKRVIWLGDLLDTFDGLTEATHDTCKFIRDNVDNPDHTFLYGNHDIHYAFPRDGIICGGWTKAKKDVVDKYLSVNHWEKFKLFAWTETEKDYLCSHAGIHPNLLHPIHGFSKESLLETEVHALSWLKFGKIHPLVAPGRSRGGYADIGGVTWMDWSEFKHIEGLNQIVGHTPAPEIRQVMGNYCVDTHLNHVIIVDEQGNLQFNDE